MNFNFFWLHHSLGGRKERKLRVSGTCTCYSLKRPEIDTYLFEVFGNVFRVKSLYVYHNTISAYRPHHDTFSALGFPP